MANKSLFGSLVNRLLPKAEVRNEAGGVAYQRSPKAALAQFAATGCLSGTFYASAEDQLAKTLELTAGVEPEFVAKVALYARSKGFMKDMPALLAASLSVRSPGLLAEVFDRVIDSPKMLRNFVQIMRSGAVGRRSLGTLPKWLVRQWLDARSDEQIFRASTGNDPSLADIIRMTHPKPGNASRAALYGYLIGKAHDVAALPALVKQFEAFKAEPTNFGANDVPDVPMEMVTSLALSKAHWRALAAKASWQTLRMNLNTFQRHGVFEDAVAVEKAAAKLRDRELVLKARVFPYQLLAAFTNASDELPGELKGALQDAMEIATANVPRIEGKVWVLPDVSGSMQSAITGRRAGGTSKVRCLDVAALVSAAIVRRNPDAEVVPFAERALPLTPSLNPRDSVMTNAARLASLPGGGTNCSAALEYLNERRAKGDVVIYVSDNESWIDSVGRGAGRATATLEQWQRFKSRNKRARLVCLDLQPYGTTQAPEREDILNIGGFSDSVFEVIARFGEGSLGPDHWVGVIESEVI